MVYKAYIYKTTGWHISNIVQLFRKIARSCAMESLVDDDKSNDRLYGNRQLTMYKKGKGLLAYERKGMLNSRYSG